MQFQVLYAKYAGVYILHTWYFAFICTPNFAYVSNLFSVLHCWPDDNSECLASQLSQAQEFTSISQTLALPPLSACAATSKRGAAAAAGAGAAGASCCRAKAPAAPAATVSTSVTAAVLSLTGQLQEWALFPTCSTQLGGSILLEWPIGSQHRLWKWLTFLDLVHSLAKILISESKIKAWWFLKAFPGHYGISLLDKHANIRYKWKHQEPKLQCLLFCAEYWHINWSMSQCWCQSTEVFWFYR